MLSQLVHIFKQKLAMFTSIFVLGDEIASIHLQPYYVSIIWKVYNCLIV